MVLFAATAVSVALSSAQTTVTVYSDGLAAGWEDWSWATHAISQGTVVHGGSSAASFEPDGWEALMFHSNGTLSSSYVESIEFWIRGGGGG